MKKKSVSKKNKTPDPLASPKWLSESSLQSSNGPANPAQSSGSGSGTGPGKKKITIEFSKPAQGKNICCGKSIAGKATASGADSAKARIKVTAPDGTSCGEGTGECTFNYTPKEEECGQKLTFTANAEGFGEAKGSVNVVKITISEIERVPIHADKAANLRKCKVVILPDDVQLVAKLERVEGEGESGLAKFAEGGTSKNIKGTLDLSIGGVQNSDKKNNMRLYVSVDGDDCAEQRFSVRTWPKTGMFLGNVVKPEPGVLWFAFQWSSETDDVADLTPKLWVGEVVNYEVHLPIPPYGNPAPDYPTVIAEWPGTRSIPTAPKLGSGTDKQKLPKFQPPTSADVNTAKQTMGFWDEVLDGEPTSDNVHSLQGPIEIKRIIEKDAANNWTYRVEKLISVSDVYKIP